MAGAHDIIQHQCFKYLWNNFPQTRLCCWHTPNETRPHKGETSKDHMIRIMQMKSIGVVKGVVDLVFYWNGVLYMFDIKIGKDRLSKEQRSFIDANINQGGRFYEINNLEEFIKLCIALQLK